MYKKALIVLMAILAFTINAQAADGPPNVVLLISDDHSWIDYGFMGHPHVQGKEGEWATIEAYRSVDPK